MLLWIRVGGAGEAQGGLRDVPRECAPGMCPVPLRGRRRCREFQGKGGGVQGTPGGMRGTPGGCRGPLYRCIPLCLGECEGHPEQGIPQLPGVSRGDPGGSPQIILRLMNVMVEGNMESEGAWDAVPQ